MGQQDKPSIEEILDSIKQVIARDDHMRERMAADRRQDNDLTAADDEAETEDDSAFNLGEDLAIDGENAAHEYENTDEDTLTRGDAREAMRQNFAALAMLSGPGKQPQIVRQGETSLEGLAREMLRPMLAEWLDRNLPGMVEDLVKAEISRIAGKRS